MPKSKASSITDITNVSKEETLIVIKILLSQKKVLWLQNACLTDQQTTRGASLLKISISNDNCP